MNIEQEKMGQKLIFVTFTLTLASGRKAHLTRKATSQERAES